MRQVKVSGFENTIGSLTRLDKPVLLCSGAQWPDRLAQNPGPTLFQPDKHPVYEIAFAEQGSFALVIRSEAYKVEAGSVCIIPAQEEHYESLIDPTQGYKVLWSQVYKNRLSIHANEYDPRLGYVINHSPREVWMGEDLEARIDAVVQEARRHKTFSEEMIRGYLLTLVSSICRQLDESEGGTSAPQVPEDDTAIREAISYIDENYSGECNVRDIARHVAMSTSKFYRYFKAMTQYSPYQYIQQVRMNKACQLLVARDWSVSRVSNEVGYTAPYHFRQLFKREYGLTPTEYRRQARAMPVFHPSQVSMKER